MLSFSKAKVGRHWASKFDLLIPDLTCFQCQAPSQNFQTNVTTTTKTIRMGTCLKKEYICVQKNLPGSWDTQYKMQILELWKKYVRICGQLQNILNQHQTYWYIYLDLGPSQNIRNIEISTCICGPSLETPMSSALLSPELVFPGSTFFYNSDHCLKDVAIFYFFSFDVMMRKPF